MTPLIRIFLPWVLAANPPIAPTNLVTRDCEFGDTYAFNSAECEMELDNRGDLPVRLSGFVSDKPGDAVAPAELILQPHARAYVRAALSIGNEFGHVRHVFRFHSDEPGHENRVITARGYVTTVLDDRPLINFGVVDLLQEVLPNKLELTSHDVADFRVQQILSAPDWLDVNLAGDGRSISAKVRNNAQWGFHVDQIKLRTNTSIQKEVWVGVQADIHGSVVPAFNPLDMGLMRTGNHNEHKVRLTSTSGKRFAIGKVELEGFKGDVKVMPCEPATDDCRLIRLTVADDQNLGTLKGKLWVELPDYKQKMPIAVWGMLVGKDAQIEKVDATKPVEASNSSKNLATDLNLKTAIKDAVQTANVPDPAGKGPLLKWTVANGQFVHGYQIFRSDAETGPFLLLNKDSVASTNAPGASSYQYRDNTAESGKTYWYYIGIVFNDGHKQQLTGPQKDVAK